MLIQHATRLLQEACACRHLSVNTEKSYTQWRARFGAFLRDKNLAGLPAEQNLEAFLTRLAVAGLSASTQNQAFNAPALLLPYRPRLAALARQRSAPVSSHL
jgi:hypothetical protein